MAAAGTVSNGLPHDAHTLLPEALLSPHDAHTASPPSSTLGGLKHMISSFLFLVLSPRLAPKRPAIDEMLMRWSIGKAVAAHIVSDVSIAKITKVHGSCCKDE